MGNFIDMIELTTQIFSNLAAKYKTVAMRFRNVNEMYAEINLAEIDNGIPISLIIHSASQTPYADITAAFVTRTGDIIKCVACSNGKFVEGHILSTAIVYLQQP